MVKQQIKRENIESENNKIENKNKTKVVKQQINKKH